MTKNKNFQYNFNIQEAQLNDCFQLSNLHLYCLPFDPGSVLGFTFLSKTLYPHMIEHTICTLVAKNLHGDLIGFIGVGKPLSWVQFVHFNMIINVRAPFHQHIIIPIRTHIHNTRSFATTIVQHVCQLVLTNLYKIRWHNLFC